MEEKVKMRWGDPKTRNGKRLTPGRRDQVCMGVGAIISGASSLPFIFYRGGRVMETFTEW